MLRVVLVNYLILSTLASHWLCCCSVEHLLARPSRREAGKDCPASRQSSCCCHRERAAASNAVATAESQRSRPSPGRRPCPCREQKSHQVAVLPANSQP